MSEAKLECCYYSVLGLGKQATASEIREAYRRLALKWHPDKWMKQPRLAVEAKKRFQIIQQAYSVLTDKRKRSIYDAGLFGFLGDDDDEGFCDFMQEMVVLMKGKRVSLEDLKGLLLDMMADSERAMIGFHEWNNTTCPTTARKRIRTCT